jgi:regulator of protease activity HflC (stomatin/prohibitin superfamily)
MKPELASAVRGLTSEVEAKALYTSGRALIQEKLKVELAKVLMPRGIVVEDVLLKAVTLPKQLAASIELKAQAEQESARMQYVLSKERQEADRKEIEAKGIAAFQKIVSEGISPALLQWKAVEATEKLITSPNSKVIMVGNTHNDLPIMLSGDTDSLRDASAAAKAAAAAKNAK